MVPLCLVNRSSPALQTLQSTVHNKLLFFLFFSGSLVITTAASTVTNTTITTMEHGECSGTAKPSEEECWAKLVPLDSKYSDIELKSSEIVVCSETSFSSYDKFEWCKITRNPDQCSAVFQNLSSNLVLVDGKILEKADTMVIHCGTEIISGPDKGGYSTYEFKVMSTPDCKKHLKISFDVEHAKCSICLQLWHDVVTVAPCLHNFCNGCFSEWLRRCQKKNPTVPCPQCRAVVHFVGRNHFLRNIEESMLQTDPSLQRSSEDFALLDRYASIESNLVIKVGKMSSRKRPYSPPNEERDRIELPCPQCGTGFGGFQCNQSTAHLQCQACGGMMPSRADISIPQHCLGCDRAYCGAYWQAQGVLTSDSHPVCRRDNFKPISERTIASIPLLTHQNNRYEQDITLRCIRHTGKTLQDIISDWVSKLNNREIDRTRMPLHHAEMITAGTHLCDDCYDKLVSFLLYWFRVTVPSYHLPSDVSKREDCWYGYACRTQHHNEEHARRRNHVCRPTRGRDM